MKLLKWNELPNYMQTDEVYEIYEILKKKKLTLCLKRIMDIVLSLILIIILSPLLLILSVWIKLDSNGSVFYRQERVTQYGKKFRIFKFRTMITDADKKGSLVTIKGDDRITKVGKYIRKIRLDEVPQLFNILLGDMSFVGTRPEVQKYVQEYDESMLATLLLPAGVTSNASIQFKDEEQFLCNPGTVDSDYVTVVLPKKMEYNLDYMKKLSILLDIKIMFKTIISV